MTQHQSGYVKSETRQGITTIEFYHPQSNSLPSEILAALAQEIYSASNDNDTKVIILRSPGEKTFCAGASFEELASIKTSEEGLRFFSGFAHVINAMRKSPRPIIGRIHGKCVGGGVGLVAATDYAIATQGADIKLSELAIGIGPFVVGPAVERKIGIASFSHLSIDATVWRDADWAMSKGLYAELHATVTAMDESIARLSNTLAHSSTEALSELKKITWKGTEHWDTYLMERAEISGRLVLSEFTRTAIQKFRAK